MAFSTVPTPLYAIYQARDGFSTFLITVIFAAYAVGVIAALFFAGHLSDYLGRRRALVPAVILSLVAAAIILTWRALPGLLVARILTGLSVGVVTSTATAFVSELHLGQRPGAPTTRGGAISTTANLGGFCLGPLIAGLLAQFVRAPLTVPFVLFLGLLVLAAIVVALAPETVTRPAVRPPYRPQRIAVPAQARGRFLGAAAAAFVSFASLGLFAALGPTFLAGTLHDTSRLLSAVPASAAFAAAVVAQLLSTGWPARRMLATGMVALAVGMLLVVAATWLPSLALFLIGGTIAGGGGGLLFKGGTSPHPGSPPQTDAPRHSRASSCPDTSASQFRSSASGSSPSSSTHGWPLRRSSDCCCSESPRPPRSCSATAAKLGEARGQDQTTTPHPPLAHRHAGQTRTPTQ